MQRRLGFFSFLVVFLGVGIYLFSIGMNKVPMNILYLAMLLYFICCLPTIIFLYRSESDLPYLPIFGIFYFIYFGLGIFTRYKQFESAYLHPETVAKCLYISLTGFISLLIAFYTPLGSMVNMFAKPLKLPLDYRKAYKLSITLGLLGTIVYYFSMSGKVPLAFAGPVAFITQLPLLSIAILYTLQLEKRITLFGRVFLWIIFFPSRIILDLSTGSTFTIILDFMIFFFIFFYYYKRIAWLRVVAAVFIFMNVFAARDKFRDATWYGGEYMDLNPVRKGLLYLNLIYGRLSGERSDYADSYEQLLARADYMVTFIKVVELTPAYIPFWGGYTYSTLFTSFIPRFIMPGKPLKKLGMEFGHRYMFVDPQDFITSYNLSLMVEMYINFGEIGVIIGMFILALIFRILYRLFNHPACGEGGFLISVMIFTNLLNIESDFSLIFGAVVQYAILFYIVTKRMKLKLERIG